MPNIITSNEVMVDYSGIPADGYDYEYPYGLDLKPGSPLHEKLKNAVYQRARESATIMSRRFDAWKATDQKLTGYIDLSSKEQKIKDKNPLKPVSIVFPYSYAILETMIAYLIAAFCPEPIFRYEGVSPEDEVGAILMEQVIKLHCNKTKVALGLHTMFRDSGAYGFGIVSPVWSEKYGLKTVKKEKGFFSFLSEFVQTGFEKASEESLIFEGNGLENVDPYTYLPDTNVPIHRPQDGEFVGWVEETNFYDLLKQEGTSEDLFNVKYLRHMINKRSNIYGKDSSGRMDKLGGTPKKDTTITKPVDVVNMYIKLIPEEWGLGDEDTPEKWLFSLGSDSIIIRAKKLGLDHNLFPIAVCAPDFDGYSPFALSRVEIMYGMQETLDWLFNSHIANVRKAINDMIIVDPYLVNMADLKDPEPGKLIRLRRPAWGRGVDKVAQQLAVNDITKSNLQDATFIMRYMQQIGATDNPVMGTLRQSGPERLTKGEFQGSMAGAVSRLERVAKVIGLQAMQDIGYMFAYHTQQLMSQETYVKSIGSWSAQLMKEVGVSRGRVKVSPYDVLVDYDLYVRDGSVPGGNYAEVWTQLFQIISQQPLLLQKFDITRIFKHIARNLGAKNVEEFIIPDVNPQVMPDEQVEQQVGKGNVIPLSAAGGAM